MDVLEQKNMITVGLDLSLTKTGWAIMEDDGLVTTSGVIKSHPLGDKPIDETNRIVKIAEEVVQKIDELLPHKSPDLVVIENLAFMARNTTALTQLAGLSHIVRILLVQFNWPFILEAPSTLKKFITGKGNSDKNVMMMSIYKNYGHEFLDDNIADAFGLAACGMALLGKPLKKLGKAQEEVINLLKAQIV